MKKKWYKKSLKEIFDTEDYYGRTLIDKIAKILFIVFVFGAIISFIIIGFLLWG